MIPGTELRSWLGDRARQARSKAGADDSARAWYQGPVHGRFRDTFDALPDRSPESVAAAVRSLFDDHRWADDLVRSLAAALRADPLLEPPFRYLNSDIHSGLLVFEHELVSIAAGITGAAELAAKKNRLRDRTSIGFTGYMTVLKFVKSGGATMSFWDAPEIGRDFTAADAGRCSPTGRRRIEDGEILTVDGRSQSYVIEHASANILLLQANVLVGNAPLSVEYDSQSLEYAGCSAADDRDSRVQMMATLLRKMDHPDAFETILPLTEDASFFVRWHAMRELLGVDAAAALPRLVRMAEADPHPDARRAAAAVLARVAAANPEHAGGALCRG